MKSYFQIFLPIILLTIKNSQSSHLNCEFLSHYSFYYCKVLNVLETSMTASSVVGIHKYGKGNSDVDVLLLSTQSLTKYVPLRTCSVLKNLKKIDISGRFLEELQPDVFSGCKKVNGIKISHLKLTEIDENIFANVPNLEAVSIIFTNIEILPKNLFKNNQKLAQISLMFNKFKAISTEFPVTVSMLSLQGNTCIDDIYVKEQSTVTPPTNPIINFIKKIYNSCKNESAEIFIINQVKAQKVQERIEKIENEIWNFDEYFQLSKLLFQNNLNLSNQEFEVEKEFAQKFLTNLTEMLKKAENSTFLQNNLNLKVFENLKEEIQKINLQIEKNSIENLKIYNNYKSKIINENRLIITLFCFQIAIATVLVILIYLRKI